jgi:hypothetical protein
MSTQQGYQDTAAQTDFVSGNWSGTWSSDRHGGHGGSLRCRTRRGDDGWHATFTGQGERIGTYEVEMAGRKEGDTVTFEGEVDLGPQDGGTYRWRGSVTPSEFRGSYSSEHDNGSFTMTPDQ